MSARRLGGCGIGLRLAGHEDHGDVVIDTQDHEVEIVLDVEAVPAK